MDNENMNPVDRRSLSLLQRVLLASDGTVTDIIEAAFLEPIRLVKIREQSSPADAPHPDLATVAQDPIMQRWVLLQGDTSGVNHVYAESLIALDRLPPALREGLLNGDTPIGRLWAEQKMETRKELLRVWKVSAGGPCEHFGDAAALGLLARTYRVFFAGLPIMVISEYFPIATTQ
jgi:chorismate-pyruvate lyase